MPLKPLLSLVTAVLIVCRLSAAQAPGAQPTIRQTVNNVLVDVVVTDKAGQPLLNLTKDKFQILENDVPQQIAYFEEHVPQPAPAAAAPPPQLPPGVYTDIPTTPPDNGPTLVLLMDALNTQTSDQVKVRAAMLDYLRRIPQGRHIAIFTLTDKLHMLQGFNADPASLLEALDRAAAWQKTHTRLNDDPGQDTYADFMETANPMADARVIANFISHEQPMRMDERVANTLNALDALATYLGVMPGRKSLLWFSGSFPITIGDSDNLQAGRNYSDDLHHTADLLKLARVALYPIDPGSNDAPSMFSSSSNEGGQFITDQANASLDRHTTSDLLAESTGGRAFHGSTDIGGAINAVARLSSTYYTIAYVPKDEHYDGKYRKLTVKVDAPKTRLDYSRGYYAIDPLKLGPDAPLRATNGATVLLHGGPASDDIFFKIKVAPARGASTPTPGTVPYSVNWAIDLKSMGLTQSPDGSRHGTVSFNLVAYNPDSKPVASNAVTKAITLQPDDYEKYLKSAVQFHQEIALPTGPLYLRVAIVNTDTDRTGSTEIPLKIAPIP